MNFVYETYPSNERMNTLANHELVHVACFDRASGVDPFFRGLFFGKVKGTSAHPETILYNYLTALARIERAIGVIPELQGTELNPPPAQ